MIFRCGAQEVFVMRMEKVAPNKIRLTFTGEDLKGFDIDFENLRYNSDQAQDVFWYLLEQADIEQEFFADGAQLVVEAVATKDNGLTMLVTRVGDAPKRARARTRREPRHKRQDIDPVLYRFHSFEDVVAACKNIENKFVGVSRLYKCGGAYYLVLNGINEAVAEETDILLLEFGEKVSKSSLYEGYLGEYGKLLIDRIAVGNIAVNF